MSRTALPGLVRYENRQKKFPGNGKKRLVANKYKTHLQKNNISAEKRQHCGAAIAG
jgi:hypothetical protein